MLKAVSQDLTITYRATYRYLRWVMVATLLGLFVSVLLQSVLAHCWLGSVSAYYYTPARTVFVGSLIAFGAALIAYQGRTRDEDIALNFAGTMAIVVAMVPTKPDGMCASAGFELSEREVADAVVNNIWSLIATMLVVGLVKLGLWLKRRKDGTGQAPEDQRPWTVRAVITLIACAIILIGEFVYFLIQPNGFIDHAHGTAALTMVAGLGLVMFGNAWFIKRDDVASRLDYRLWYRLLFGLLIALVVAVLWVGNPWVILILELVVFAVFVAYWILQSIELWGSSSGGDLAAAHPVVAVLALDGQPAASLPVVAVPAASTDGKPATSLSVVAVPAASTDGKPASTLSVVAVPAPSSNGKPVTSLSVVAVAAPSTDGKPASTLSVVAVPAPSSNGKPAATDR